MPPSLSRRSSLAPLLGFFSPSAHAATKVHCTRVLPARYVPPSGFGYPLGGLLPSKPRRLSFAPAALLGSPLRSFLLSRGARVFPPKRTHIPFCPAVSPPRLSVGPARWVAVSELWPSRKSLAPRHVFSTIGAGYSLGGLPFQGTLATALPGFRRGSSRLLSAVQPVSRTLPATQSIGRLPPGFIRDQQEPVADETTLLGFLRRHHPEHLISGHLRAMGSPCTALNITAMSGTL